MGGVARFLQVIIRISLFNPWLLGDPENFIPANPLVTPVHIQPEWYFLFAYAILRSVPNKLGGVIALAIAVIILFIIPFYGNRGFKRLRFYPLGKFLFGLLVSVVFLLTWIGARPVEEPYVLTGQILTVLYFLLLEEAGVAVRVTGVLRSMVDGRGTMRVVFLAVPEDSS